MCLKRLLLIFVLAIAFDHSAFIACAQQASSTPDMDQRFEDLRTIFKGQTVPRDELDRRIRDLQSDLRSSIASEKLRTDALDKTIHELVPQIEVANNKLPDIEARIQHLLQNTTPWWAAPTLGLVGSLLGTALGGLVAYKVAAGNRAHAERQAAIAVAQEKISTWMGMAKTIGDARGILQNPQHIKTAGYKQTVTDVGNYYEILAADWRDGIAHPQTLAKMGMKNQVKEFHDDARKAKTDLAQMQDFAAEHDWLTKLVTGWASMEWLIQQPD